LNACLGVKWRPGFVADSASAQRCSRCGAARWECKRLKETGVKTNGPDSGTDGSLYAQVLQADGRQFRNILLTEARLDHVTVKDLDVRTFLSRCVEMEVRASNGLMANIDAPATGIFTWTEKEIRQLLELFKLDLDTPLSVLVVEMMPRYDQYIIFGEPPNNAVRPLSRELGQYRILRTSPLVAAPEVCCEDS
jgi:hypothetical protein